MWHVNERRAQKPHYWATWECKYHVVFIPKYRKKAIFGVIKKRLGDVFHELARRRESKIEEGYRGLLRVGRKRPHCRRTEKRDEFPPPHVTYPKAKDGKLIIATVHRSKKKPLTSEMGRVSRASS